MSVVGVKRMGYVLGGVVVMLLVMGVCAEVWANVGLTGCEMVREDILQSPYYVEDIGHTEISYKPDAGYNLNFGLKHFGKAIHPVHHEGYMSQ